MKAFYAGSFDPFTKGHMAVCLEILANCGQLIIGVGNNAGKKPLFDAQKRVELVQASIDDFVKQYLFRGINGAIFTVNEAKAAEKLAKDSGCVKVVSYEGTTIHAAMANGADWLVRGQRPGDYDEEVRLAEANRNIAGVANYPITQVLVPPPRPEFANTSSSGVKEYCRLGQFIPAYRYVPPSVHNELMKIYLEPLFYKAFGHDLREPWVGILLAYSAEGRYHHNLSHLAYGLNLLESVLEPDEEPAFEFVPAWFYHDYIMGSADGNDEELSAKEAREVMSDETVGKLILATRHSKEQTLSDIGEKIISDIDLAILGDTENYGLYAQHIFMEYGGDKDPERYAKGRAEFLGTMLSRKKIFQSTYFARLEGPTRANMAREKGLWEARK